MEELISTAQKYLDICKLPMHIDKPTGDDKKFLDFIDDAKDKCVPISLGYMYRFNPAVIEIRKILAADKKYRKNNQEDNVIIGTVF